MEYNAPFQCNDFRLNGAPDAYKMCVYLSIEDVHHTWDAFKPHKDIFFSSEFLGAIEKSSASGITPYYIVVNKSEQIIALLYFQYKFVRLSDNLRYTDNEDTSLIHQVIKPFKDWLISKLNFRTLICGNLLLTGSYGGCFSDHIPNNERFELLNVATQWMQEVLKNNHTQVDLILIKDYFEHQLPSEAQTIKSFTQFSVQPKMIFSISPDWNSLENYLDELKSKYRIRARKAQKSSQSLQKSELDLAAIYRHQNQLHALYKNVSDQAGFNAFVLPAEYFSNLKDALGDKITFMAYWKDQEMIAFYTIIRNQDVLDAHFLGYKPELNKQYGIYLNMLLDLISEGIKRRATMVDMSRTAIEIKSSVGSKPIEMFLYLRHTLPMVNLLASVIIRIVNPRFKYTIRHPFRD